MKLRSRDEIEKQKSSERKLEIDEGVKLANRVDALRKTSADEGSKLSIFRNSTLTETKSQIDNVILERDSILTEVLSLRKERLVLMKPLDDEWEKIYRIKKDMDDLNSQLEAKEASLNAREEDIAARGQRLIFIERETIDQLDQARDLVFQRQSLVTRVEDRLATIEEGNRIQDISIANRVRNLDDREVGIALHERALKMREDQVVDDRRALLDKERALNDREETLVREELRNLNG